MLLHKIKIALRVMVRQRFFSILNIAGLAFGSASVLLIYLYVQDELKFDKFHEKSENIFRVNMTNIWIQGNDVFGSTGPGVARALKNDIENIEEVVRLHYPYYGNDQVIIVPQSDRTFKTFQEGNVLAVDSNFFEMFTLQPIRGDLKSALHNPGNVVLNESTALNYFDDTDVIGRSFEIGKGENKLSLMVSAVVEDLPAQSHFQFEILIGLNSFQNIKRRSSSWHWTTFVTYILLDDPKAIDRIETQIASLPAKYVNPEDVERLNWQLYLQPFEDVYLYSADIPNRLGALGSIQNILIFSVVAVLILLLSCVNFMNLSTARFADRLKEIGVQKVLGSSKTALKMQFFTESLIYALIGIVLGMGLAELLLGPFNMISGKVLSFDFISNPDLSLIVVGLIAFVGAIAGAYPAWFLTRFKAVEALKGKPNTGKAHFRNILVVFQFSISIALISVAFLVKSQMNFVKNKDLGFDKENLLAIQHLEWLGESQNSFVNELKSQQVFSNVSYTTAVPPQVWNQDILEPMGTTVESMSVTLMNSDSRFLDVLELELVAGRNFFSEGDGDLKSVIINEQAAYDLGYLKPGEDLEKILGQQIKYYMAEPFKIIGVLKDFNFWSLRNEVEPLAIFHRDAEMWQADTRFALIRMPNGSLNDYENSLTEMESTWRKFSGDLPFSYEFVDDQFNAAFEAESKFGQLIDASTVLAVFIATLGLIGLISYTTEQRTKELGIRKVLGASISQLIILITKDFVKLLLIATVLGTSVSYLFGEDWLQNFPHRIQVSPGIFIVSTLVIVLLIGVINIIIIANNSRKNPAVILRDE